MKPKKNVARHERNAAEFSVFIGSRNVFADLGVRNPEEALLKAKIVIEIERLMQSKRWKLSQLSRYLGIDRARTSALLRGRLGDFSFEQLLRFVNRLGQEIDVNIRPREALSSTAR